MNLFIRLSKVFGLWLVMLALIIGPFGATANQDTLEELLALQAQIDSIELLLEESFTLTTAQRDSLDNTVSQIEDEIALRTAIVTSSTTMEVVIEAGPLAKAQVITAARVVNLDFSFNESFATATPAMILADVVTRTAFALKLNEETLASGAKIVGSFSGIQVPSQIIPVATSTPRTPEVSTTTLPEIAGRTNLLSMKIGGSVPDYTITAEAVYGPEAGFDQATITKLYSFTRPSSADSIAVAMRDLVSQGRLKAAEDFGVSLSFLENSSVTSIERYKDRDSVPTTTRSTSFDGTNVEDVAVILDDSPISYFGFYSVIEEIRVSTNDVVGADRGEALTVTFQSDQDEIVRFSLAPEYELRRGRADDGDSYVPTGKLQYGFSYSIHGEVLEYVSEGDATFSGFVAYLEQYFAGIGVLFEMTDEAFIAELADFLADNNSDYEIRARTAAEVEWTAVEADLCYEDREKDITKGVISYMLDGMQFTQDLVDITYVFPNSEITVGGSDDDRIFFTTKRCNTESGFFPSVPEPATSTVPTM